MFPLGATYNISLYERDVLETIEFMCVFAIYLAVYNAQTVAVTLYL